MLLLFFVFWVRVCVYIIIGIIIIITVLRSALKQTKSEYSVNQQQKFQQQ